MKLTILFIFFLINAFTLWLRQLNLVHLRQHGSVVPVGFEGSVSQESLAKSAAYTMETSRFALWDSLFGNVLLLLFLFAGLLPLYDRFIVALTDSFIFQGVLFFLILTWIQTILEIPFSLYSTFRIEARHGFNTMTPRLWLTDFLKSQVIGSLLLALVVGAAFWLMQWSSQHWWLWLWGFLALFGLFMMFISPYVIEPLFNRFEPLTEEGLQEEIAAMMSRADLKVGQVMQMDASRRSSHSNAYFTGIGKVKRIVLFDTLIKQMSHQEIVAVLAHEIGHWKLGHILRRVVAMELIALVGSWLVFQAVQWPGLPGLFGLAGGSMAARLVLVGFIGSLLLFPLTPFSAWLSRRHERQADDFACRIIGRADSLATALVKLAAKNLSNLHPHPFYAAFYFSHPPVVERVRTLRSRLPAGEGVDKSA